MVFSIDLLYYKKICPTSFPRSQGVVFKLLVLSDCEFEIHDITFTTTNVTFDKEKQQILPVEKVQLWIVLTFFD